MPNSAVIYFSHAGETYSKTGLAPYLPQGNGERLSRYVASKIDAPYFRIIPAKEYSRNYEECLKEAKRDKDNEIFPELLYDMDPIDFKNIILIYPNWFNSCPMPVFTYLANHSFEGKYVVPICTHGGSGFGNSIEELKTAMPGAIFLEGKEILGEGIDEHFDEIVAHIKRVLSEK